MQLVEELSRKKFDISVYKDTFVMSVQQALVRKGTRVVPKKKRMTAKKSSLTDALKASLKKKQ